MEAPAPPESPESPESPEAPLPAALLELLVSYGMQTEPGRAAVAAVMAYHPQVRAAADAAGGQVRVTVEGTGRLTVRPDATHERT